MKKRFTIKAIILLLVIALTSGCVKLEVGLKITNSDVDFTYIMGIQKAYLSMLAGESDPIKEQATELKDDGFTVEDYDDGTFQGKKATKRLGSLADLSTEEDIKDITISTDKLEDIKLFKVTSKSFFKTTYKASFKTNAMDDVNKMVSSGNTTTGTDTIPTTDDTTNTGATTETTDQTTPTESATEETISPDEAEDALDSKTALTENETVEADDDVATTGSSTTSIDDLNEMNEQLQKSMKVTFKVELPSSPGKNNATTVDGKTLTWDLTKVTDGAIEFEFSTLNMTNVFLVGGGALLLLIIIVLIILMASKKKKKVVPAEFADRPIPEVVKENVVTPTEPTEDTPELTPVGEPSPKVEAPATEETV